MLWLKRADCQIFLALWVKWHGRSPPLLLCSLAPLQCFCFFPCTDVTFCCGSCMVSLSKDNALIPFFFWQKCGRSRQASAPVGPLRQLTSQLVWQTSCGLVSQLGQQAVESITSSVWIYDKPLQCLCYTRYQTLITEEREGQQPLQLGGASENTLFSLLKALSFSYPCRKIIFSRSLHKCCLKAN